MYGHSISGPQTMYLDLLNARYHFPPLAVRYFVFCRIVVAFTVLCASDKWLLPRAICSDKSWH